MPALRAGTATPGANSDGCDSQYVAVAGTASSALIGQDGTDSGPVVGPAEKGEDGVRSVFEFAEWDCDLEVRTIEDEGEAAGDDDELPMQPVPFDLSILDDGVVDTLTGASGENFIRQ